MGRKNVKTSEAKFTDLISQSQIHKRLWMFEATRAGFRKC